MSNEFKPLDNFDIAKVKESLKDFIDSDGTTKLEPIVFHEFPRLPPYERPTSFGDYPQKRFDTYDWTGRALNIEPMFDDRKRANPLFNLDPEKLRRFRENFEQILVKHGFDPIKLAKPFTDKMPTGEVQDVLTSKKENE